MPMLLLLVLYRLQPNGDFQFALRPFAHPFACQSGIKLKFSALFSKRLQMLSWFWYVSLPGWVTDQVYISIRFADFIQSYQLSVLHAILKFQFYAFFSIEKFGMKFET